MMNALEKNTDIMEALPYIRRFQGKIFVIKCGGAVLAEQKHLMNMIHDIALMYKRGIKVVVVHGGGPDISSLSQQLNIPVQFTNGQRVTDEKTMNIVQMVLSGKVNPSIVSALNQQGVNAVGISGQDAACIHVTPYSDEMGFVGDIHSVKTDLIQLLLWQGYLPVISPIGVNENGQAFNINGDIAAGKIAAALKCEKLMILSDVNGLYADTHDSSSLISTISSRKISDWLDQGVLSGGIIPKLKACLDALNGGVYATHILNGKIPQSLAQEVFTEKGIGTMITRS